MIFQFLQFGLVGFLGLLLDFGITYLLKEKARINRYVANATGFTVAVISNYTLNRIWTFRSNNPDITGELLWFVGISLVGLGMNTMLVYLLHGKAKQPFYASKFVAIVIVFCWNFFANALITFA